MTQKKIRVDQTCSGWTNDCWFISVRQIHDERFGSEKSIDSYSAECVTQKAKLGLIRKLCFHFTGIGNLRGFSAKGC